MENTEVYAIVLASSFFLLLLLNGFPLITRCVRFLTPFVWRHLLYRNILERHQLLGPWSRSSAIIQLIYATGNICCLRFWDTTFAQAGLEAGVLAMINLIPLLAIPHLSALADLLGVSLSTIRRAHFSAGVTSVALTIFHVLVMVSSHPSFPLKLHENLFAVIGASSLGVIIVLSLPLLRKLSYEIFLRVHQALAVVVAYSIWRHVPAKEVFPRAYLYISAGIFLLMFTAQSFIIIHRNGVFRYSRARAHLTHEYGAIRMRIQLQKPVEIRAGQFINLWIPSVAFRSFLQSHPFVVISWADKPQDHIDLFIEARSGLTGKLLAYSRRKQISNPWVLFSGPHGKSIFMGECENILMVATGFGIAAHLPYLKQMIRGYNTREVRVRRIHLVWQVRDIDVTIAAQPLLNDALNEDTLEDGWILAISIYCESSAQPKSFGKRAKVFPGRPPLRDIFRKEVTGECIEKRPIKNIDWGTKTLVEDEVEMEKLNGRDCQLLVTVSGSNDIRDELRSVVRDHLTNGVKFFELDFQPSEK